MIGNASRRHMITRRALAIVIALGVLHGTNLVRARQAAAPPDNPPRFRVATDGVRIDAVVTDSDGHIVPNLTADDFEVRQDGKLQKLLFAQFVPVLAGAPSPAATPAPPAGTENSPSPVRPGVVRREDVQRTFAIVVDDLGLSAESVLNTQKALHAFVDRELRPTDLVAFVRTGGSTGALQPFTTDRRVLHASIDRLRWNVWSRNGVEPFKAINLWLTFDYFGSQMARPDDFKSVDNLHASMSATGTLGALNLVVRGARDLPGRKAVIFVSEGFVIPRSGGDARVRIALDRVIDQATRAGVVIYALDCRGLQSGAILAGDNLKVGPLTKDGFDSVIREQAQNRTEFNRDTQEGMAYLAEQTGGFAVMNTNDLPRGLGRITDDVRDYYVIGYTPQDGTFLPKGKKPELHKISIKVKRPGMQVKTRKEFLGVSDPQETSRTLTPAQELVHTAISPFAASDIALRATTLPGFSVEQGSFVRALLHIDARALTFSDDASGKKAASVDVLGMVFDQDGQEVAHLSTGFAVALTKEGAQEALRDGLAYTLRIPIRHPGAYQVRFAVRDRQSASVGSAGEYIEIPDMAGGAFALSGIVLRTADGMAADGTDAAAGSGAQLMLTPAQAVRLYAPGSRLSYAYEIYNATRPVQATMSIWRGTEKVLAVPPDSLAPPAGNPRIFAAGGALKLGEALTPGSYVLQIAATTPDSAGNNRSSSAVQRVDFEVR